MNRHHYLYALLAVLVLPSIGRSAADPPQPKVEVRLLAEHTAIVPGKPTTLAIEFSIEPEWHIYWQNRGQGGLEPSFNWRLPEGYDAGPIRFPPPRRHVDATGAHTYVLEGEPVLLTELKVPASAKPGETVTLGLEVGWLVCRELCVAGEKAVSLTLPVVAEAEKVEASEPVTFKSARASLPAASDKAKYLSSISAVANVDKVAPGTDFQVAVTIDVQKGYHLNSHRPLNKFLIGTDLFPYKVAGLNFDLPKFPVGEVEEAAPGMKVSLYRGKATMLIPVTASRSLKGEAVDLAGVVTYQACSDVTKSCFPPTSAEWRLKLPIAREGERPQPVNAAFFADDAASVASGANEPPAPGAVDHQPEPPAGRSADASAPLSAPTAVSGRSVGGTGFFGAVQRLLDSWGLAGLLLLSFVGGLLMNIMPCVLPVVSIKVLSFVQQAKESRLRVLTLGLAFSAGIQLSFIIMGLLILGLLKALGLELQWGGLFQKPALLIALTALVTALALSLFGVFTLSPPRFVLEAGGRIKQEGHVNAFAMGLLATILGTACTAPFVSWAVAKAATSPPAVGMMVFVIMGLGMALPYVALAAHPAWLRFIPKPGTWMKTFEQFMAFLLLGTVVFLLHTVMRQLGGDGLLWTVVFLLFVSMAAWCYGQAGFGSSPARQAACYGGAVLLIAFGWWLSFHQAARIGDLMAEEAKRRRGEIGMVTNVDWNDAKDRIPWVPYTRERVMRLVDAGKTVFIDYTADWCINCKANEELFINTPEVRTVMRELNIAPVRADFTLPDPEIKADLERFNRAGVPMYVIIPAKKPDAPIVLNEILTKGAIIENLRKAGPSVSAEMSVAAKEQ